MIIEAVSTASTIDEARALAAAELGAPEDADVEFEIIDLPEKKILGLFGGKPAKVRAFYDDGRSDLPKKAEKPAAAPVQKPVKADRPHESKPAERAPRAEKPAQKPAAEKSAHKADKKPEHKSERKERPAKQVKLNDELINRTVDYLKGIIEKMDCGEYELEVKEVEGGFCIRLTGDGLGIVIGRRGETLDSLQYLVSLFYNNNESSFVRVVLDANDYRTKRETTLTELARKVADQVVAEQRNQSLEPMNPYERRVIHTAIQEIDGLTSWSITDGRERRVIIGLANPDGTPVDPDYKPMRRADRGRNDRHGRGPSRGDRRPSRPRYESSAPVREKRSDAGDLPLFGRVDVEK